MLGFLFYLLSNSLLLFSPVVRAEYAARNPASPEPTVRANDVAFAGHAFLLSTITLSQFWGPLWGFRQDRNRGVKGITAGIAAGCVVGVLGVVGVVLIRGTGDPLGWAWIDVVSFASIPYFRPIA